MHEGYFEEARQAARQATCRRAHCGSVIVAKDGSIIGRGFNAPPNNDESQRMCDVELNKSIKQNNDKTCCVHAEWNAILDALKHHSTELEGSTLYFMRVDDAGEFTEAGEPYCTICSRLALQSGIKTFGLWNGGPDMIGTDVYNQKSYSYFITNSKK
jgi:deoxycytidylate deaminase